MAGLSDVEVVALRRVYLANLLGGIAVTSYLVLVSSDARDAWLQAAISFMVIGAVTAMLSSALTRRIFWKTREWWSSGREPTVEERVAVLRIPGLVGVLTMGFWLAIAAGGGALMAVRPTASGARVVGMVAVTSLAGAAASVLSLVLTQWSLRPLFARALRDTSPTATGSFGVHRRLVLLWALGSALPTAGIVVSPFAFGSSRDALISAVTLGVVALIAGYGFMTVAARSVAEPITDVRRALHETVKDISMSIWPWMTTARSDRSRPG